MFGFQFDRVSGQSGLHALVEQFGDPFARDHPLARGDPVPLVTELGLSAGEGGLDVLAGAVVPTHGHRCGLGFDGLGDPRLRRDIRFRRFAGIAYSSACGACLVDEHVVADPVETFGQIPAGHDLTQPEITLRQVGDRLQHEGHRGFAAVGGQAVEQIRHGFAVRRRGLGASSPRPVRASARASSASSALSSAWLTGLPVSSHGSEIGPPSALGVFVMADDSGGKAP